MKAMAVAEGMPPKSDANNGFDASVYNQNFMSSVGNQHLNFNSSMGARRTAYAANQHSISVIGSDIGRAHLPQNFAKPMQTQYNKDLKSAFSVQSSQLTGMTGADKIPRSPARQAVTEVISRLSPPGGSQLEYGVDQEESLQGLIHLNANANRMATQN